MLLKGISIKGVLDKWFPKISVLYRYLRDNWYFIRSKPYDTVFGFQLIGDKNLDISRHESNEVNLMTKLFKTVDYFVDIGANVGLFTIIAYQCHVATLSVEPCFNNLKQLYRNLKINNCNGIEVYPLALGDAVDIVPIFGGGQGASLLKSWGGIHSTYQTLVPVNTLDNLIADRLKGKRLLIKMDVDGNEFNVLRGATVVLRQEPKPIWIIEHGLTENFDGEINPNFEKLFNLFWQHGYTAYTIENEPRLVNSDNVNLWVAQGKRTFGGINYMFK